jgi:hypothetical protein
VLNDAKDKAKTVPDKKAPGTAAAKEEKKTGAPNAAADQKKPAAQTTGTAKVKTAVNTINATGAISKKGGNPEESDPIEESLNLRIKAGGVT